MLNQPRVVPFEWEIPKGRGPSPSCRSASRQLTNNFVGGPTYGRCARAASAFRDRLPFRTSGARFPATRQSEQEPTCEPDRTTTMSRGSAPPASMATRCARLGYHAGSSVVGLPVHAMERSQIRNGTPASAQEKIEPTQIPPCPEIPKLPSLSKIPKPAKPEPNRPKRRKLEPPESTPKTYQRWLRRNTAEDFLPETRRIQMVRY